MVGVVGFVNRGTRPPEGTLDSMAEQLRHYPHHLKEVYRDNFVEVARVHLGIYNPGPQPVFNADRTLGILGEGRAYSPGVGGQDSQTEEPWLRDALQAFEETGPKSFARLNGSFSLVIFDNKQERLHLVSDRFATRPLYYWHKGADFAFSTEAKAILRHPGYDKELNLVAVSKFFRYGRLCVFGDDTWFAGVKGLPPGSMLTLDGAEATVTRYWDLAYSADTSSSPDELSDRLVSTFREAVRVRTADQRLRHSVALSGGLDSRAVLAGCDGGRGVGSYTFGALGTREIAIASKVARAAGARHLICHIDPESTARFAEDVVWLSDGLEVVGISFLLDAGERLRGAFDVSMDGFALDLTLGGSFLRKNIIEAKGFPELAAILDKKFAVFSDAEMKSAFSPDFLARLGAGARASFLETVWGSKGDNSADRADYFALRTRVRNFTIMGHVLSRSFYEDSIPTLDNDFMDVLMTVPVSLRYHYAIYRKFLRKLNPALAAVQYERTGISPNRPFPMWMAGIVFERAIKTWNDALCKFTRGRISSFQTNAYLDLSGTLRLSRAWRDLMARTLVNHDSHMYSRGIIQRGYVLKLVADHMSGRRDNREKILYLITFELILRRFFSEGA